MNLPMNRLQVQAKREMLKRELAPLEKVTFSCQHCENFDPRSKVCSVFDESPPAHAHTQDIGCESWAYDTIPF